MLSYTCQVVAVLEGGRESLCVAGWGGVGVALRGDASHPSSHTARIILAECFPQERVERLFSPQPPPVALLPSPSPFRCSPLVGCRGGGSRGCVLSGSSLRN